MAALKWDAGQGDGPTRKGRRAGAVSEATVNVTRTE